MKYNRRRRILPRGMGPKPKATCVYVSCHPGCVCVKGKCDSCNPGTGFPGGETERCLACRDPHCADCATNFNNCINC